MTDSITRKASIVEADLLSWFKEADPLNSDSEAKINITIKKRGDNYEIKTQVKHSNKRRKDRVERQLRSDEWEVIQGILKNQTERDLIKLFRYNGNNPIGEEEINLIFGERSRKIVRTIDNRLSVAKLPYGLRRTNIGKRYVGSKYKIYVLR